MDKDTTLLQLRLVVKDFIKERDWEKYHTPKNLAMSITIEASELMELFQWYPGEDTIKLLEDEDKKIEIGDEIADIMIYCLAFANQTEIDISEVVHRKLEKNELRFPPGQPLPY